MRGEGERTPPDPAIKLIRIKRHSVSNQDVTKTRPQASTSPTGSRSRRHPDPCPPSASGARPRRQDTSLPCPATLSIATTTMAVTTYNEV